MQDLIVAWTEGDGTRCVLSSDKDNLVLRVIEANGQVTHSEPVAEVLHALRDRAPRLRRHTEATVHAQRR